ncbi:MAG: GAF domain-containing protein [Chloroflexi bacterium]|nr:GAF domain-containing protein [Chloroflexota bacterium]MBV9893914.1 GAF domain-containing protein [Chloroflexota bacterium]
MRLAVVGLIALAVVDVIDDAPGIHLAALIGAVILAGLASLLAVAAAEPESIYPLHARRWQLQAVASAVVMFMLMTGLSPREATPGDLLWFLIVVGAASTLVAMATSYHDGGSGIGGICLAFDSAIIGFTTALLIVSMTSSTPPVGGAAVLLGAFAAAGYAVAVATRPAIRLDPHGSDALFLGGVLVLCLNVAGDAARQIGLDALGVLSAPGVALFGTLGLARSAWRAPRRPPATERPVSVETRLSLAPALAAGLAIVMLTYLEVDGRATRAAFFGIVTLFGLVVGRLLLTLVVNRQLLQRVERSGLFEEKLRDLGGALVAALDSENTLELVCRTAQLALATDSVVLWMVDPATSELEAMEVLGPKRESVLGRRFALDEPTSLVARVARTGAAEIISGVPSANASNGFLNVLLHAQALLAVPVTHRNRVQGVLVCVDARNPAAYGPRELGKAELLASHVSVALDNAHQHALQQQRLEELSALYQFAQSAHTAFSAPEIMRQLVPILRGRLNFASCTIWLRDETTGTSRVAASEGPVAANRMLRPSPTAMRSLASGEPCADAAQLAVPMVLKRKVVGVVDLVASEAHGWSATDERLLVALASHAALAVDNLHLLDETRKVAALRELDRMKTELLGTVSHELRTPLGSIKGYATTLLTHGNRLRKDEQREFLEIIDSEADRLRDLIENLLDLSRLEAGVLRIDREPARLARSAREVTRKVQLTASGHQVVLDWPDDDPLVDADEKRIYQVMQNLITNSVKYSPDGGCITLSARSRGRELIVSVTDEGLGIPASEIDKIFDRFHRVQTEMSRGIGGTGLGLAICKGLIEAHGGRIWAESGGDGKGSTFRFTLPLLADVQDAPTVSATPSRSKGAHDHQEANRPRRR